MLGSAQAEALSYSAVKSFLKYSNMYVIMVPERYRRTQTDRQTETTYCGITALCVASCGNKKTHWILLSLTSQPLNLLRLYNLIILFWSLFCLPPCTRARRLLLHLSCPNYRPAAEKMTPPLFGYSIRIWGCFPVGPDRQCWGWHEARLYYRLTSRESISEVFKPMWSSCLNVRDTWTGRWTGNLTCMMHGINRVCVASRERKNHKIIMWRKAKMFKNMDFIWWKNEPEHMLTFLLSRSCIKAGNRPNCILWFYI